MRLMTDTELLKAIEQGLKEYINDASIESLKKIEPDIRIHWEKLANSENDYRTGETTYGYKNPKESAEYILDRFNCAFRLNWILGLLSFSNDRFNVDSR